MSGSATSMTTAAGLSAFIGFVPFGVPRGTLMLGGGCFLLGVAARAGASLFRKLDGTQNVTWKDFVRPIAATHPASLFYARRYRMCMLMPA